MAVGAVRTITTKPRPSPTVKTVTTRADEPATSLYFSELRGTGSAPALRPVRPLEVRKGRSSVDNTQAARSPPEANGGYTSLFCSSLPNRGSAAPRTFSPDTSHSPWVEFSKQAKRKTLRRSMSDKSIVRALMPSSLYCPT